MRKIEILLKIIYASYLKYETHLQNFLYFYCISNYEVVASSLPLD